MHCALLAFLHFVALYYTIYFFYLSLHKTGLSLHIMVKLITCTQIMGGSAYIWDYSLVFTVCLVKYDVMFCVQFQHSPLYISTVFHKKKPLYFRLNSRNSWSIFIIFAPVETRMDISQSHVIFLLNCLMTS